MSTKTFCDKGAFIELCEGREEHRLVPYPVCLAIKYADDVPETCPDFVLNIDEAWMFVRTTAPLPEGARVTLHFYIPPEIKLLAEIEGIVSSAVGPDAPYPEGMKITFMRMSRATKELLGGYIEGKRPLVDKTI